MEEIVGTAAAALQIHGTHDFRYVLQPGELLEHRCRAWLPPDVARLKLSGFCEQWQAGIITRTEDEFAFLVGAAGTFWQRCAGKKTGLLVRVQVVQPNFADQRLAAITVQIRPSNLSRAQAVKELEVLGLTLLGSLRAYLQPVPERRAEERLPWERPAAAYPIDSPLQDQRSLDCLIKDVSQHGLGLVLSEAPKSMRLGVCVTPPSQSQAVVLPGRVTRVLERSYGVFEVGVLCDEVRTLAPPP
jgi:hypothetical protein